jgi:transposase-like protein
VSWRIGAETEEQIMRQRELAGLMKRLAKLTRGQRKALATELAAQESRAASTEIIEGRVPERPDCPHCASRQVVRNGSADGLQRYKCRACSRTFNALTGTPLAGLHMRGKWLDQAAALRGGLSLNQVTERLDIAQSTAFRWRHRFLALPKTVQAQTLTGIAEADETYFLRSFKGSHGLARQARRRGGRASMRGTSKEHTPVLIARDRSGATANLILGSTTAADIGAALKPILPEDTILCTDGSSALAAAARDLGVEHHAINVTAGRRVDGAWHVQNVNAFGSRLRDWLRRFKGVATKYLANYLGWFRALDRSPGFAPSPASLLVLAVKA